MEGMGVVENNERANGQSLPVICDPKGVDDIERAVRDCSAGVGSVDGWSDKGGSDPINGRFNLPSLGKETRAGYAANSIKGCFGVRSRYQLHIRQLNPSVFKLSHPSKDRSGL